MSDAWMEVRLEFLSTDEGGRATPVRSGYRPLLRLVGADDLYGMLEVVFVVDEWVEPGGSALARIRLATPEVLPVLKAGDEFEMLEGHRVVARGRVIHPPTITR
jgi:translation elongation factor EF-Tu-like GTPase